MPVDRKTRYQQMPTMLNEKQWRQFLALEAQERGSILEVALDAGVSKNTVRRGREEIEGGDLYTPGTRQRNKGAGRKKKESQDETLIPDLEGLLDPNGDPMSLIRWTSHVHGASEAGARRPGASGRREHDQESLTNPGVLVAVEQEQHRRNVAS